MQDVSLAAGNPHRQRVRLMASRESLTFGQAPEGSPCHQCPLAQHALCLEMLADFPSWTALALVLEPFLTDYRDKLIYVRWLEQ
ncbi:MAG: hypothetical protein IPH23_10020 [Gammaproteobacteria bacterium]|nr:hypothetical protein [Gammaproteobacteria bacterium]